jgi:hypothetical protein
MLPPGNQFLSLEMAITAEASAQLVCTSSHASFHSLDISIRSFSVRLHKVLSALRTVSIPMRVDDRLHVKLIDSHDGESRARALANTECKISHISLCV